jgi:hypothetical protein
MVGQRGVGKRLLEKANKLQEENKKQDVDMRLNSQIPKLNYMANVEKISAMSLVNCN